MMTDENEFVNLVCKIKSFPSFLRLNEKMFKRKKGKLEENNLPFYYY